MLFLGRLNVRLEVTSDSISRCHEREILLVEHVSVFRGQFQQTLRQIIVVLFLLERIVERRVMKVLFTIGNQEGFELETDKRV